MSNTAFQYKAVDRLGASTRGVLQAANLSEAYRQVRAAGLQPLRIRAKRRQRGRRKKVTIKDLSHFTYQFAVLMEARISIVDGLRSIADQEHNHRLREVLLEVAERIASGNSVTDALTPHREMFGEVYIETIRAAEKSGNLTSVLTTLAEMLERQYEMQKSVKGALAYPICVISALALAVVFLVVIVIPRFSAIFASRGVELPLPTQILIAASVVFRTYWYGFVGGGLTLYLIFRKSWRTRSSRQRIDTFLHRIPFLREMLRGLAISRFAHVLGLSLKSGLSLLDALELSGKASGRPLLLADAQRMREQVNHGGRLTDVLLTCNYLPTFSRRMLAAGEESAELPKMCAVIARHYDREVTYLTKNVTTVIEPIMIVGLAGVVLLIALAIFLPMWNMASLVG